jgi:hypothetical protein
LDKKKMKPLSYLVAILIVIALACLADLAYFAARYQTLYDTTHPSLYSSTDVSEAYMTCPRNLKPDFERRKTEGFEKMKSLRVVFCALCRNVENTLPLFIQRIELTAKHFSDYRVVLFENDSKDNTRKMILDWQNTNPHVEVISCYPDVAPEKDCRLQVEELYVVGAVSPTRFEKMSYFRNQYLKVVQTKYMDYDFMIVIDSDCRGPFSVGGLATCFTYEFDVAIAMGLFILPGSSLMGGYRTAYDVMAYVERNDTTDRSNWGKTEYYKFFIASIRLASKHPVGSPPVIVNSGFNGLAVYKMSSLKDVNYEPSTCEHIGLHKNMREKGFDKIYIMPSLVSFAGSQGPPSLFTSWR